MKTRIISGIVMAAIVVAVLLLGFYVSPVFITAFVAIIAAIGCYELIHNAAGIKAKPAYIGAGAFSFLYIFLASNSFENTVLESLVHKCEDNIKFVEAFTRYWALGLSALIVLYFLYAVVMVLKYHKDFSLAKITTLCAMPIVLSYAFGTFGSIINRENGIYYLLMLLNFSSICDMGAYFTGVTIGKHKLCPEISPKKTVEGAVGGIVASVIFTAVFCLTLNGGSKLIPSLIFTIPLCMVGMIGDLFASAIKRSVELKDYGTLIPGHGGVLDRVDSILMLAPVVYLCIDLGVL